MSCPKQTRLLVFLVQRNLALEWRFLQGVPQRVQQWGEPRTARPLFLREQPSDLGPAVMLGPSQIRDFPLGFADDKLLGGSRKAKNVMVGLAVIDVDDHVINHAEGTAGARERRVNLSGFLRVYYELLYGLPC